MQRTPTVRPGPWLRFVSDADIKTSMRKLCEPHQIEEQYGGTAPNVTWNLS